MKAPTQGVKNKRRHNKRADISDTLVSSGSEACPPVCVAQPDLQHPSKTKQNKQKMKRKKQPFYEQLNYYGVHS